MKQHMKSFWSIYLMLVTVVTPYLPIVHSAMLQYLAAHASVGAAVTQVASVLVVVAHWMQPPDANSTKSL